VDQLESTNDETIASLQNQINELTGLVNRLLGKESKPFPDNNSIITQISGASLEQNFPNPFNQSTVINYFLPQIFNSARIVIADTSGRAVKQIPVSETGSITIEAGLLSAGTYLYSLYVDDTIADTKKMVITR